MVQMQKNALVQGDDVFYVALGALAVGWKFRLRRAENDNAKTNTMPNRLLAMCCECVAPGQVFFSCRRRSERKAIPIGFIEPRAAVQRQLRSPSGRVNRVVSTGWKTRLVRTSRE
jgi:hypothetical protein